MLSILILGTGGSLPTPDRTPPAYWLDLDGHSILMDPGPGALVRLLRAPHGPDTVDAVDTLLFSHLHLDHCADLAPLLFALHGPVLPSERPLQLIGPHGLGDYLDRLRDLYGEWLDPYRREIVVSEIAPGDRLLPPTAPDRPWTATDDDDAGLAAFAAAHTETRFSRANLCFRFRDERGYTLAYSGDSRPCDGLLAAARDCDLLLAECSTSDRWNTEGHMTPARLGRFCAEAEPRRVVLTHMYPSAASLDLPALVKEHFSGDIVCGADNDLILASESGP